MELISDPFKITAEWMTTMLNTAGVDGVVSSLEAKNIGTGQVGQNVRYTLTGSGDIPTSIVGKFPSDEPTSRQTGFDQGTYIKEALFYQNFQPTVDIQTPSVFRLDFDPATHLFSLMMEDLAPGEQGDQIDGCSASVAELAMVEIAKLHGPRWGDDSVVDGAVIVDATKSDERLIETIYDAVSGGFLARYADRITSDEAKLVKELGQVTTAYLCNYPGKRTLIHGDYRLDNMMFGGPYPLAVVDWQTVAFGCPLQDVSYFLGTSLLPSERHTNEEALVRLYFEELSKYDVDLSWEDCWLYYRHFAPAGLLMAVIASMIVGETERGNDMFMAMAQRSAQMCRDLDSLSVIRGA